MTLIRTSFWNGIAVVIRMGTALLLNKILAIYVGPAGYAVVGAFQNAVTILMTFATGAFNTGVTKYTAEYHESEARQQALWMTAGTLTLGTSTTCAVGVILFRRELARFFLGDSAFAGVFVWLASALIFVSLNALLLAILNGKKELRRYVVSNIAGSVVALVVTGFLAWRFGLYGALVALSINQGIVFFVTLQQVMGTSWFSPRVMIGKIEWLHFSNLAKYILMAATSAIALPVTQIIIRRYIGKIYGWDYAGCWDAMSRISSIYLTLVTTTLTVYYLPRISEIKTWPELRSEMKSTFMIVVPLVMMASLSLYLLRGIVVNLLFTKQFGPMESLFAWQLMGDVFKISSWVVSFVMLGKAMTTLFVATEITFSATLVLFSILFTKLFGFPGVSIAYLVNYAIYLPVMWYFIVHRNRHSSIAP
jgi:PST family polysaccharide transporter